MVSLPPSLQLTLTWGASTLWTKRVELPCDLDIPEIGGRLLGDRSVCELRTATSVHPVRAERRLRTEHGELELVVDAVTDDIAPAVPSVIDPRRAAFDLGSMVLHAAIALMLFMLADPLAADLRELPEQDLLPAAAEQSLVFGDATTAQRSPEEAPGGHRAVDKRAPGAAGPGARTFASLGEPRQPTAGGPAIASKEDARGGIEQAESMSMISLISRAQQGAVDRSNGDDAWSGAGLDSGPSWGNPGGIGGDGGVGALSLSGIGEGGGSHSEGINLAGLSLSGSGSGSCDPKCMGALGGSHRTRPPRVSICGSRYEDGQKVSGRGCATSVSGRLPPEVIQRIVRQNFGRFRVCYENDLRHQPSLSGRVSVSFTIARDGSVGSVAASGESVPASTATCVGKAFGGLSFPQPEGGVVRVVYPITFSPG
jgi:hypothetical protein